MLLNSFLLLFCILNTVFTQNSEDNDYFTKFENYSLYKVKPYTIEQVELLERIKSENGQEFDIWNDIHALNQSVSIMISPQKSSQIISILNANGLDCQVIMKNVQDVINKQIALNDIALSKRLTFNYNAFNTFTSIQNWIDSMQQTYPQYVSIFTIGKSFENRLIRGLKIAVKGAVRGKKAVFLEGGIHSREWLSPATVIAMTSYFLSDYGKNPVVTELLDTFDLYVAPVVNPDGYEHTFAGNRMWRKTRSGSRSFNDFCVGTDPNRNWDSNWGGQGASPNPCDDSYFGVRPFSEIEMKQLSDFLFRNKDTLVSYISVHTFGQYWMFPYGYKRTAPADYAQLNEGAKQAVNALYRVSGTAYTYGTVANVIYVASGGSIDWAYDTAKIKFSYALELRDKGDFGYGFLAPPSEIRPTSLETYEGIKTLLKYIKTQI